MSPQRNALVALGRSIFRRTLDRVVADLQNGICPVCRVRRVSQRMICGMCHEAQSAGALTREQVAVYRIATGVVGTPPETIPDDVTAVNGDASGHGASPHQIDAKLPASS